MRFGVRFLLLVALLLPIRGAMAVAGVLCHGGPAMPAAAMGQLHDGGHAHGVAHGHAEVGALPSHADADASAEDGHARAPAGALAGTPGDDAFGGATCPFCSAVCGAPPLPRTGPSVHAMTPSGAERFPALPAPRALAAFGAPERPPRAS